MTDRTPDAAVDLELFKFDSCPYCVRVLRVVEDLGLSVRLRDTHTETGARDELQRRGGMPQVPCLFIDGEPLYESADIIAYLRDRHG